MNLLASWVLVLTLVAGASGAVLLNEGFDTVGTLNSYSGWSTQFPFAINDPIQVTPLGAVVSHNAAFPGGDAEDIQNHTIGNQGPTATTYAGFDLTIDSASLIAATTNSRFFFFVTADIPLAARIFLDRPSAVGDYSLRISNDNVDSTQTTDLIFGTTYRIVVGYDGVLGTSVLWIDPIDVMSVGYVSPTVVGNADVIGVEFEQRGEQTADLFIDNLLVGTTFDDVTVVPEPGTVAFLLIGSVAVFSCRRQVKNLL